MLVEYSVVLSAVNANSFNTCSILVDCLGRKEKETQPPFDFGAGLALF